MRLQCVSRAQGSKIKQFFSERNQISDQGLRDWQAWMSAGWREIVRLFVLAEPIPQSSATEGLKRVFLPPLLVPPPVAEPATRCRQAACIDAAMFADQTDFITR